MDNSFDLPPPFVSEGITKILLGENIKGGLFTAEQLRSAVEAEREACERIVMDASSDCIQGSRIWHIIVASAAAIRARGKS